MTAYSWSLASNGNWSGPNNWSPSGGPPTSADSATISATGSNYSVTVNSSDAAGSLTLSSANATVNDDGASASLTIGGTLAISAGTLNVATTSVAPGVLTVSGPLNLSGGALTVNAGGQLSLGGTLSQTGGTLTLNGGTIAGGTINSTAGTLTVNSGTLSGVTFDGPLSLTSSGAQQSLHLANGATVVGSSGSGPGTVNVTGFDSALYFDDTQTVSNETIYLGNSSSYDTLYGYDSAGAGNQVLTLVSSVTLNVVGSASMGSSYALGDGLVNQGLIDQTGGDLFIGGNTLTNRGVIDAAAAGGELLIESTHFANMGTIDVANGDSVTIDPTNFTTAASSLIKVEANSSLAVESATAWTNLGSITLASGASLYLYGSMSAASLGSISNSGGTVYIGGTYDNTGQTLDGSGPLGRVVLYGGAITGGTATSAGVAFTAQDGTLSGVTFDGPLNLTSSNAQQSVHLASGSTVVGSSGSGRGIIKVTGYYSTLYFDDAQTVSKETITLGNASGYTDTLYGYDTTGAGGQVLNLASSVSVNAVGNASISSGYASGDGILNHGVIDETGGDLSIRGNALINSGMIDVFNGASLTIAPTTFTTRASSLIKIEANSSVTIYPTDAWSNIGSIALASGANLYLYGSMSAASLGSISNSGGTVNIGGTYDNTGQTLDGSASFGQLALYGGAITGGAATSAGVAFTAQGGTLSGVTFAGPLDLTSSSVSQSVDLADGATVVGSSGSGPGTINVTGYYSTLYFDDTQTVGNETITLGNASGFTDTLYGYDTAGAGARVLTLGASVTVDAVGNAIITSSGNPGDGIVNQGVIDQTAGSLQIGGNAFTNGGTIDVANGDTATIAPTTFTNLASHTLTGGTYEAEAGSTLEVDGFTLIRTLDADVILSGAGSQFLDYYSGASGAVALDSILHTIGASGELQLLAGRDMTFANAPIVNDGVIRLGGGTLTSTGASGSLTDAAGSTLFGFGTVTAATFANSGTIEAKGGTLTLTNAVTGTGDLEIDGGATLEFDSTIAAGQKIGFSGSGGTLDLTDPLGYAGSHIAGFSATDTVDLAGAWSLLKFTENSGGTLGRLWVTDGTNNIALEFVGNFTKSDFTFTPSGPNTVIGHS